MSEWHTDHTTEGWQRPYASNPCMEILGWLDEVGLSITGRKPVEPQPQFAVKPGGTKTFEHDPAVTIWESIVP